MTPTPDDPPPAPTPRPDLAIEQEIALHLAVCRTACLASVDDQGVPHAANVQYAHARAPHGSADHPARHATTDAPLLFFPDAPGLWLFFVSSPRSAHAHHMAQRPRVALTIYHHDDRPDQIRGLQLHGRAEPLAADSPAHAAALAIYTRKYPFVREDPRLAAALAKQTLYRVEIDWLRWIDNRRGFGFRVEIASPPRSGME